MSNLKLEIGIQQYKISNMMMSKISKIEKIVKSIEEDKLNDSEKESLMMLTSDGSLAFWVKYYGLSTK